MKTFIPLLPPLVLTPGKITTVLDAGYGSSSKGLVSAWITKKERPAILLTANGRNSSHTVVDSTTKKDGLTKCQREGEFVFKVLPVGAYYNKWNGYSPTIYIGPGAAFTVEDLKKEIEACELDASQVFIHPLASVVTIEDIDYENGIRDFSGNLLPAIDHSSGTTKHGTTGSGVGAARAKKSLRKGMQWKDVVGFDYAVTSFQGIERVIIERLKSGNKGLLDGSQGYLLSLYGGFFPHCTSRPVTLASFFADVNLPISLAGNVCAVARTFPIRIASHRYFYEGKPLTLAEKTALEESGKTVEKVDSNSGPWYDDQLELTWEELSEAAGKHIEPQLTSLTKLPRRIATWSKTALKEFIIHNEPTGNSKMFLFVTFLNYLNNEHVSSWVDDSLTKLDGVAEVLYSDSPETDSVFTGEFSS